MLSAAVVVGGLEQGRKMLKRNRNDKETVQRMQDGNECNALADLEEASQFLSCMIEGVYKNCLCEKVPYAQQNSEHWTRWGYKRKSFNDLAGTYDEVHDDRCLVGDLGEPKEQCVRAVLFERSDSQRTIRNFFQRPRGVWTRVEGTPDRLIRVELPKYVLAIRGTILSKGADIKSDIKIGLEILDSSDEGMCMKRLLRAIIGKYNPQDIWVAGHSLGAALALIATRFLAIDRGIVINPHLFNLPYLTVDRLASKAMQGVLNGVGDVGNKVLHVFGMENTCNIRAGTDKVANKCKNGMRKLSRKGGRIANSSYAETMENESQKLLQMGYVPKVYVNPKDTICNEYIEHFKRYPHANTSLVSAVTRWVVDAKSVHMIPSAVLYINNWAEGPLEAHNLLQWFRYPHVNLTVERQGLTGRPDFRWS